MTSRALVLTVAAAAAALSFASLPASAAMPVATGTQADPGIVQVQATAPAATPDATTPDQAAPKGKKRSSKKSASKQKELDKSVESGTVPRRYMQNVPKQYHDAIPWAKQ